MRCDVDLEVELADLGLEVGVGDRFERLRVDHGRMPGLVGQVELDLQPDGAPLGIELVVGEHLSKDLEAALDLLAVTPALLTSEVRSGDRVAHSGLANEHASAALASPGRRS